MKAGILGILLLVITNITGFAQKVSLDGYKIINGTQQYFKVIGTGGDPILVIHGGPGMAHDYFLPYLMPLTKTNTIILYDQRSTGKSVIPEDTFGASHKNMIDDIEAIRKAFKIKKLNILAHSWGAKLAVNYALKYPANLKSIIFCNAIAMNHDYDSTTFKLTEERKYLPQNKKLKEDIMHRHISSIEIKMRLAYLGSLYNPETVDKIKLSFPVEYADMQIALFRGLSSDYKKYDIDYFPLLNKIKCPVLVIHGDADALTVEADQRLADSLPNARLLRFTKSGHFPFIEEEALFAKEVTNFIKALK